MRRLRSERKARAEAKRIAWSKDDARGYADAVGVDTVWIFRNSQAIHTSVGLIETGRIIRATLLFIDEQGIGHFEGRGKVSLKPGHEPGFGLSLADQEVVGTFEASFGDVVGLGKPKEETEGGPTVPPGYVPVRERAKARREDMRLLMANRVK